MNTTLTCKNCSTQFTVRPSTEKRLSRCPSCKTAVVVHPDAGYFGTQATPFSPPKIDKLLTVAMRSIGILLLAVSLLLLVLSVVAFGSQDFIIRVYAFGATFGPAIMLLWCAAMLDAFLRFESRA